MRGGLAILALVAACSGERSPTGLGEPLRVRGASFKDAPLPGTADAVPSVTALETASTIVRPGQTDKAISGRTSPDAVAIALSFADRGYWVLPVDGPDPANGGELGWQAAIEIARDLPAGPRGLRVVAIDAAGHAGQERTLDLCVASSVPDNLASCNLAVSPPAVVVALTWDTPVDLDLVVVGPDGRVLDAKRPAARGDGGVIDRDSNAACVLDRIQREDLVWQTAPPAGSYFVYANLFDACGRAPVHFRVEVVQAGIVATTHAGTLLATDANGGARLGTFVTELTFQ